MTPSHRILRKGKESHARISCDLAVLWLALQLLLTACDNGMLALVDAHKVPNKPRTSIRPVGGLENGVLSISTAVLAVPSHGAFEISLLSTVQGCTRDL